MDEVVYKIEVKEEVHYPGVSVKRKKRRNHQVCAVLNCPNPNGVSYHSFPKEPELLQRWIHTCGREKVNIKTARVCGSHFLPDDFLRDLKNELLGLPLVKRLKPGCAPTLNLGLSPINCTSSSSSCLSSSLDKKKRPMSPRENRFVEAKKKNGSPAGLDLNHEATSVINQVNQARTLQKLKSLQEKYIFEKKRHRMEVMVLKKELKHIKSKSYVDKLVYNTLLKTQTPAQASKILKPDTNVKGYTKKDITFSLALQSISNKAYKYIDSRNILALPSNRTLERWIKTTHCPPGLQESGLQRIKDLLETSEEECERFAVVSLNEMFLKKKCEYDTLTKNIFGPHSKVQTVIVSGLFKDFSQPVYYEFDTTIHKNLFLDIIQCLEQNGILVIATTISLRNHKLISELGINSACHSFPNPHAKDRLIYAFADTLHMLRLMRNYVLDNGFQIPDGSSGFVTLVKEDFESILRHDSILPAEEKLHPRLTDLHITCKGSARKRILLAIQLFSESSAKAIAKIADNPESVKAKAVFIINNWFDVMNSNKILDSQKLSCGFGIQIIDQLHALDEMERLISNMLIGIDDKITRLPFQDSIVMSIRSTKELYSFLKMHNCTYLLTRQLNHSAFDAFQSGVRDICADGNFPSALKVVMHLRMLNIDQNDEDATLKTVGGPHPSEIGSFLERGEAVFEDEETPPLADEGSEDHHLEDEYGEEEEEEEDHHHHHHLMEGEHQELEEVQFDLTSGVEQIIAHEETIVPDVDNVIEKDTQEVMTVRADGEYFFTISTGD